MTIEQIAHQLYVSLNSMPCRCTRKWDKSQKEGYTQTHFCSRCVAVQAYLEYLSTEPEAA